MTKKQDMLKAIGELLSEKGIEAFSLNLLVDWQNADVKLELDIPYTSLSGLTDELHGQLKSCRVMTEDEFTVAVLDSYKDGRAEGFRFGAIAAVKAYVKDMQMLQICLDSIRKLTKKEIHVLEETWASNEDKSKWNQE